MKHLMKIVRVATICLAALFITSCSKDDPSSPGGSGSDGLKLTVTSSTSFDAGKGSIQVMVGATDDFAKSQLWTVNGEAGSQGVPFYYVRKDYFTGGKTAVLELNSAYTLATLTIGASASKSALPYTVSYKVEQAGKVLIDKTEEVTSSKPLSVQLYY